jgi:HAD superfamily hydrolase (TIGR01509 family)
LLGVEKPLREQFQIPEERVLQSLGGNPLAELCRGRISENIYLTQIIEEQGWDVRVDGLKQAIRRNFHQRVPGMRSLLHKLGAEYELALLSDHALEWIAYIQGIHPFLNVFSTQAYSFETGLLKCEPLAFQLLLETIGRGPGECLFVDDNPGNVHTARAVGIASIHFMDAPQLVAKMSEYGVRV